MGLQLIVKAGFNKIEKVLGELTSECEIFPIAEDLFGILIPNRILSSIGEDVVQHKLEQLKRFDLWEGRWQEPKRRWFW